MLLPPSIMMEALGEPGCEEFFRYLNDHRSDDGKGETGYFIPLARSDSCFPQDKEKSYPDGLSFRLVLWAGGVHGSRGPQATKSSATSISGPTLDRQRLCDLGQNVSDRAGDYS